MALLDSLIAKPLVGHAAIRLDRTSPYSDEKVLVFGGWDGRAYSDDFYLFDTSTTPSP